MTPDPLFLYRLLVQSCLAVVLALAVWDRQWVLAGLLVAVMAALHWKG